MSIRGLALSVITCWLGVVLAPLSAQAAVYHPAVVAEDPADYTPHLVPDDATVRPEAYAMVQLGDTLFTGGRFGTVSDATQAQTYSRDNLFSFSATTGQVTEFAPDLDGRVWALASTGDVPGLAPALYVGGDFTSVNGSPAPGLAKVDPITGAVDLAFHPPFSGGRVTDIELVNGRLIVSGSFLGKLLALDPMTGADTGYVSVAVGEQLPGSSGKSNVLRFAVNDAGTRLVAIGNFATVNGLAQPRAFMLRLRAAAASLSPWYYQPLARRCLSTKPERIAYLQDVDFAPDGSYFVIVSTGYVPATEADIGKTLCDAAARFETSILDPYRPEWINYTGGDTIHSVAVTGAAVYVQGHFRWLDNPYGKDSAGPGAVVRKGIGAIDPAGGFAMEWDPPKPAVRGGLQLLATPTGLWVPSDSLRFNGEYHRGIAFCPLATSV